MSILFNSGNGRPCSGRRRTTYGFETEVLGSPSGPVPMRLRGTGTSPRDGGHGAASAACSRRSHSLSSVISRNCAYTSRMHSPLGLNRNL